MVFGEFVDLLRKGHFVVWVAMDEHQGWALSVKVVMDLDVSIRKEVRIFIDGHFDQV